MINRIFKLVKPYENIDYHINTEASDYIFHDLFLVKKFLTYFW